VEEVRIHKVHRRGRAVCAMCAIMVGVPCLGVAQEAAAPSPSSPGGREIPRPDQLEPGVSTTQAAPAASSAAPDPAPQAAPAPTAPASAAPAAAGGATKPGGAAQGATTAKAAAHKGPDRLELDTTDITGNRELPKVLYIVPWKRSDLGDVVGKPVNSLLDEVLQPLDRDVFRRENRYYDAMKPGPGDAKAGAAQGSQPKP
jgi:hypothetical protein